MPATRPDSSRDTPLWAQACASPGPKGGRGSPPCAFVGQVDDNRRSRQSWLPPTRAKRFSPQKRDRVEFAANVSDSPASISAAIGEREDAPPAACVGGFPSSVGAHRLSRPTAVPPVVPRSGDGPVPGSDGGGGGGGEGGGRSASKNNPGATCPSRTRMKRNSRQMDSRKV